MKTCIHCNQELVELFRNDYHVFYKCGCNRNKGADWDWKSALAPDGTEYVLGASGSFVLQCPECKRITNRMRVTGEVCLFCRKAHVVPVKWED